MTEAMPVLTMESTQLRLSKSAMSTTSGKLFRPLVQSESTTKSEAADCGSEVRRSLHPARKKLTTLEAQRVVAVLTTAIRRVELASVLPQLVAERRADLDVGFGAELTRRLEEHGILLGSLDELRDAEVKQQSRASSAVSAGTETVNDSGRDSASLHHSTSDVSPTGSNPDDQVTSSISTRSYRLCYLSALFIYPMYISFRRLYISKLEPNVSVFTF